MVCFALVVRIKQHFSLNRLASLFTLSPKFASPNEEQQLPERCESLLGKPNRLLFYEKTRKKMKA